MISHLSQVFGMTLVEGPEVTQGRGCADLRWRSRRSSGFQAVCGAASLGLLPGLLPDLCVGLLLSSCRLRLGLGQLCDVKHEADAQVELSQDSPELGDQVKLHDLAQQRVVPGRVGLELEVMEG